MCGNSTNDTGNFTVTVSDTVLQDYQMYPETFIIDIDDFEHCEINK